MVAVEQDVTERLRAEQALRQSEETLRALLDAIPEPALLMDQDARCSCVNNPALAPLLALRRSDLIGRCMLQSPSAGIASERKVGS